MKAIQTYLWFDGQAEAAVDLYVQTFPDSRIDSVHHYHESGAEVSGMPEDSVMSVAFEIGGLSMVALNGGPLYSFTPATSFFVHCPSAEEVDRIWSVLSEGGEVLMDLGAYPFSERYGWVTDRFGIGWQVMLSTETQPVVPCLLFTGDRFGRAKEAIDRYVSLLPDARVRSLENAEDGSVLFASVVLDGMAFAFMESGLPDHHFTSSPAVSFLLGCETTAELDRIHAALSDGGEAMPCGWVTDRFGVTWQVVPSAMFDLLQDEDPARAERVMRAMLAMGKIDLDVLERVWRGGVPRPEIVVETVVRIPVEKAWDVWTKPEHILRWNQASEDWHTTAAMNDLRAGGRFSSRMEAKDGGAGFDFFGVHDRVEPLRVVSSTLGDGRHLRVEFTPDGGSTHVRELFEAEGTNPPDLQRQGWQSILDHYRAYAEGMA